MKLILKLLFCFLFIHFGFCSLYAQENQSNKIIKQLDDLYRLKKIDSVISLSNKTLESLDAKNSKDSLLMSKLYLYKYLGLHNRKKTINNITFLDAGIKYCPKSNTGDSLKATL